MTLTSPTRWVICALGAWLFGGCVYGVRGGAETLVYTGGPVVTQATVTGVGGFGSTSRDGHNSAIVETLTLGVGGDARQGGYAVSAAGGLEWFSLSENASRRWGYRLGLDAGYRWRNPGVPVGEILAVVRGGPVFRLRDRHANEALLTLGIEATLGVAASPADENSASIVGGLAITLGATSIHFFHL